MYLEIRTTISAIATLHIYSIILKNTAFKINKDLLEYQIISVLLHFNIIISTKFSL